jgi:hypothetical protein
MNIFSIYLISIDTVSINLNSVELIKFLTFFYGVKLFLINLEFTKLIQILYSTSYV